MNRVLSDHTVAGPMIGRQAFRDAQFERDAIKKLEMLSKVEKDESKYDLFFGILIIVNLIFVGVEIDNTDPTSADVFWVVETCFLIAFIFELLLRVRAHRFLLTFLKGRGMMVVDHEPEEEVPRKKKPQIVFHSQLTMTVERPRNEDMNAVVRMYWLVSDIVQSEVFAKRVWLAFDLFIILVSAVDVWIIQPAISLGANELENKGNNNLTPLRILRLLRIMRTLKLFRYFRDLWLLITGLGKAFVTILWVFALLIITNYLFALLFTTLVTSQDSLKGTDAEIWFGKVPRSMYTLFVIMTLESWNSYCEVLMEVSPGYIIIFVLYIMFTHFTVLNLFIGVVVDHVQRLSSTTDVELMREVKDRQQQLFAQLHEVFTTADVDNDECLTVQEFRTVMRTNATIRKSMADLGVNEAEVDWLFDTLDTDASGSLSIDEFVEGVLRCKESELARNLMQMQYGLLREIRVMGKTPDEVAEFRKRKKYTLRKSRTNETTTTSEKQELESTNGSAAAAAIRDNVAPDRPPVNASAGSAALMCDIKDEIRREIRQCFAQLRQEHGL